LHKKTFDELDMKILPTGLHMEEQIFSTNVQV
jgi:hypothetical protein